MAASALGWVQEERSEPRDTVHHRTRAAHADGRILPLVIVNTSLGGIMARCEQICEAGDRLRIDLPLVGALSVEIRWALGGRIGCRLLQPMSLSDYYTLLGALKR